MCVHVYDVGVCASAQVFIGICALSQGERMQREWQRRRENGGWDLGGSEGEISPSAGKEGVSKELTNSASVQRMGEASVKSSAVFHSFAFVLIMNYACVLGSICCKPNKWTLKMWQFPLILYFCDNFPLILMYDMQQCDINQAYIFSCAPHAIPDRHEHS